MPRSSIENYQIPIAMSRSRREDNDESVCFLVENNSTFGVDELSASLIYSCVVIIDLPMYEAVERLVELALLSFRESLGIMDVRGSNSFSLCSICYPDHIRLIRLVD